MAYFLSSGLANQAALPGGFWTFIWSQLLLGGWSPFAMIINYGLRVVVFTIALKLLLSPLDIMQRIRMKKNQVIIEGLKPEIEKLEKQFGANPRVLQAKKQELNKKNGVKMMAGCLPMLLTMVISIWVLMGGLQPISQYQNMIQYLHLYDAFTVAERDATIRLALDEEPFFSNSTEFGADEDNRRFFTFYGLDSDGNVTELVGDDILEASAAGTIDRVVLRNHEAFRYAGETEADDLENSFPRRNQFDAAMQRMVTAYAQEAVFVRYFGYSYDNNGNRVYAYHYNEEGVRVRTGGVRESFLWVRNIWESDVPWAVPIRDSTDFLGAIGRFHDPDNLGLNYTNAPRAMTQEEFENYFEHQVIGSYSRVMGYLYRHESNTRNGLLLLPIFSIIVMVGSQILMRKLQKKSGQGGGGMPGMPGMGGMMGGGGGKIMAYAMPIVFGLFSLGFTAAFAIYMVVNSMITIVITLAAQGIMKLVDKRKAKEEVTEDGVLRYGRKDPNAVPEEKFDTRKNRKK